MKERPILFSAPMVRALLAGTKTQTRRAFSPRMEKLMRAAAAMGEVSHFLDEGSMQPNDLDYVRSFCPYGQPGDRLWVREAFRFPGSLDHLSPSVCGDKALDAGYRTPWAPTQFEADGSRTGEWRGFDTPPEKSKPGKLRPGIHMPRWASRITLQLAGVRVERLQDISQADAQAEGAPPGHPSIDQISREFGYPDFPRSWYAQLWEEINGPGSWAQNPWVWVVEFKRVQQASSGRPSQLEDAPCSA